MGTSPRNEIINHLRRAVLRRDGAGLTDSQLLECYVLQREEAAFAALVHRHGPMVWGVCHRLLHHHQDTEDAFQATFLVLVRKASTLASRELLANWLYGVAYRTACKARGMIFKRRLRERQVTQMPEPKGLQNQTWPDLEPLLDEELSRLPDKYRIPIILCDLEGKTRKEAARHVGCPEGTLAARLARRGRCWPGSWLIAVWHCPLERWPRCCPKRQRRRRCRPRCCLQRLKPQACLRQGQRRPWRQFRPRSPP